MVKRSKSQFTRLLERDRRIRGGQYPNCLTVAADWEVSQKTVQRDVDYLRDQCGAPIVYDRDRKGFRYEDSTWMLPSIIMSEGELVAVLLASRMMDQYRGTPLASQLERLFDKLSALLPEKISVKPELLYTRFTFTAPPSRPIHPDTWTAIIRGLLTQQALKIVYRPFDQKRSREGKTSMVNPYHVANLQGEWYLFGTHRGHSDVRQFAIARIEKTAVTGERFELPPDFDPKALLGATFGRFVGGKAQTVRLLFEKEVADWVTERQWHPAQVIHRRKTGAVELQIPATGLFEVQRWVLSWGHCVKVLGPADLRRMVQDEIERMATRRIRPPGMRDPKASAASAAQGRSSSPG